MTEDPPVFTVVGHVNKGKSSVVATLVEDESVRIEATPGTTRECREFTMEVDGTAMFTLVDTPGFEQARHVLHWLQDHEDSTKNRPETVNEFLQTFRDSGEYPEECRLLQPIMDGAGILYVVDGSRPYSPEYESEMEILRWTGQPRMALINEIGEEDHRKEWERVLDQYFSLVRPFNAHDSSYRERIRLLRAFREMRADWRQPMNRAIEVMEAEQDRRRRESARIIADLLVDELTLVRERKLSMDEDPEPYQDELREAFLDDLRAREQASRDEIEDLYRHERVRRNERELEVAGEDLFAESTWLRLGLTKKQLATSGAVGGALIGGTIDAALSAGTFMAGTVVGGAIGALSGWFSSRKIARVRVLGLSMGGKLLKAGPVKNRQFPWILLDRALLHYRMIHERPHAVRDELDLSESNDGDREGMVSELDRDRRKSLEQYFRTLRKNPDGSHRDVRGDLAEDIQRMLEESLDFDSTE